MTGVLFETKAIGVLVTLLIDETMPSCPVLPPSNTPNINTNINMIQIHKILLKMLSETDVTTEGYMWMVWIGQDLWAVLC